MFLVCVLTCFGVSLSTGQRCASSDVGLRGLTPRGGTDTDTAAAMQRAWGPTTDPEEPLPTLSDSEKPTEDPNISMGTQSKIREKVLFAFGMYSISLRIF